MLLTQETVDRIRSSDGEGHPILSVYLGLRPGVGELRSLSPRLKELMAPVDRPIEIVDGGKLIEPLMV